MGEQAEEIFNSINMPAINAKVYVKVYERFTIHFVVKQCDFWKIEGRPSRQGPNESVHTFITSLYKLAETCKYGALQDELIRDHLVVGLHDVALSEYLQLDSDLTLATTVLEHHQNKQVKRQQGELWGQQPVAVDTVSCKFPKKKTFIFFLPHPGKKIDPQPNFSTGNHCKWCGREPHAHRVCPAKEATCNQCCTLGQKKKRQNLHEVELSPQDEGFFAAPPMTNDFFMCVLTLGAINRPLTIEVSIGGTKVRSKVDTGADVTAIPAAIQNQLGVLLQTTPKKLYGTSLSELEVLGMFKTCLQANQLTAETEVCVVSDRHMPLLGKPAVYKLGLIYHLDTLMVRNINDLQRHYPKLTHSAGWHDGTIWCCSSRGCMPLLSHCSEAHCYTLVASGENRFGTHAVPGCHGPHHATHWLVRRHSGRAAEEWNNTFLCGPYPSQQGH